MNKILHFINRYFEEIFLVGGTAVMVVVIFFQVLARYLLNAPLAWSEELARYTFVWTVWLAVPYTVTRGRHIHLEILSDHANNTMKFVLDMFFFVISALFFLYIGRYSIQVVQGIMKMNQVTPAMEIPKWICYLSLPVGCFLGALRFIQYGILRVIRFKKDPTDRTMIVVED